jgi:hypothetical protein
MPNPLFGLRVMIKAIKKEGENFSEYNHFADTRYQIGCILANVKITVHFCLSRG